MEGNPRVWGMLPCCPGQGRAEAAFPVTSAGFQGWICHVFSGLKQQPWSSTPWPSWASWAALPSYCEMLW